jgi:hypothetical protein
MKFAKWLVGSKPSTNKDPKDPQSPELQPPTLAEDIDNMLSDDENDSDSSSSSSSSSKETQSQ